MFKKWKKNDSEETRQESLERQEKQEEQEKSDDSNSSDNSNNSDRSDDSDRSDGLTISREAERGFISEIADEEFEAAEALASEILGAGTAEEITETMQEMLLKAVCYDRAVAEAEERGRKAGEEAGFAKGEEAGEVKGRNASIEELTRLELDDDGLPHPCGHTGGANEIGSIFDLARQA